MLFATLVLTLSPNSIEFGGSNTGWEKHIIVLYDNTGSTF
jgi:hypothetical protein